MTKAEIVAIVILYFMTNTASIIAAFHLMLRAVARRTSNIIVKGGNENDQGEDQGHVQGDHDD